MLLHLPLYFITSGKNFSFKYCGYAQTRHALLMRTHHHNNHHHDQFLQPNQQANNQSADSAAECCLDACRTKEKIAGIAASSFCGRRAMVNKLWFRELGRKWFLSKHEPPHARYFSEPKCQDEVKPWYLFYRWLIFGLWISIVFCSIFEIGSVNPLGHNEKWAIYLTNWDLALGSTQALLGAILVSRRWKLEKRPDFDANNLDYGKLEKIYWFLYIVTSSLALGVTITYWGLIHNPKIHNVDVLNILIHVSNSLLILIDFCVVGVPFKLQSFWWCPLLVCFYLLFTVVYYAAGGLDKKGHHNIYNILDWEKPARTLLVCAGGLIFLMITHCLLYFLATFKNRAYDKRRKAIINGGKSIDMTRERANCAFEEK